HLASIHGAPRIRLACPRYERTSVGDPDRLREKGHKWPHLSSAFGDLLGEPRRNHVLVRELHRDAEVLTLDVLDEGVIRVIARGRPLEGLADHAAGALPEQTRSHALPLVWFLGNCVADFL